LKRPEGRGPFRAPGRDARHPTHRASIPVTHLLPIIGRITNTNCQRSGPARDRPNATRLSQIPEKRFCAEGVKFRGVPKNRFHYANHYQASTNNNYLTFCFCAGAKEIGGVKKNSFRAGGKKTLSLVRVSSVFNLWPKTGSPPANIHASRIVANHQSALSFVFWAGKTWWWQLRMQQTEE
jgi:hypothetical protein